MKIIKIAQLENGGHYNQTINRTIAIPDGWAVIPDDMETPNFPFGDIEVEEIDGVMTVTSWMPGEIPEPEPEPDPPPEYVTYEDLAVAIREGVNAV